MIFVSRFRALWARLPLERNIQSELMLLHLYSNETGTPGSDCDVYASFTNNTTVKNMIKEHNISCYTQQVKHLHPDILTNLEISNVPVIVGVFRGKNLGEFTRISAPTSALDLCKRLVDAQAYLHNNREKSEHIEIEKQIQDALTAKSKDGAFEELEKLERKYMQRLEVDDILRRNLARARLTLYKPECENTETSVEMLRNQLNEIDQILVAFENANADDLISLYDKMPPTDTVIQKQGSLDVHANSRNSGRGHADENTATGAVVQMMDRFAAENGYTTELMDGSYDTITLIRLVKIRILQNIGVVMFLEGTVEEALEVATRAYDELVQMLKDDLISVKAYELHSLGRIIELMFGALPWNHPAVLAARAAIETVNGPRLLNRIPQSNRPLGGPVSKRRGFGGRYSWQGPDYRPKKYRPRDPEQYLNEWRYQPDSNLPTF
ncbi:uncharacterized protein BXIN_2741 [Babesia sp. Xinjiang]|uniref:uncharacterized protein n=1 Tax=Babesia sp. Xinjiang TaxID=462227 RepID=UPI000A22E940|nr:uncharacterized protein BXIN_2741 [Babesia sp. Xinjiang]ORM41716.1 hypothetical protein BXIN_2741 [Babesia sp. Xinjiang]